jgi:hypothetical protein
MAPILRIRAQGRASAAFGAQRSRGKNTTLLSSMTLRGMGPSLAVEGATTAVVFGAYVEKVLAPSLRPGQVLVMFALPPSLFFLFLGRCYFRLAPQRSWKAEVDHFPRCGSLAHKVHLL